MPLRNVDRTTDRAVPRPGSDALAEARANLAVVSCALHALACQGEDDIVLSKDAAYGLWKLVAQAEVLMGE